MPPGSSAEMAARRSSSYPGASSPGDAGTCGIALLLAALGMLFFASLAFFIVLKLHLLQPGVIAPPMPPLPALLWLSTFLIIGSSMTVHLALHSIRHGRQPLFRLALCATGVLALLFLACQLAAWIPLLRAQAALASGTQSHLNFTALAFYMLAVLHGLHVIGGLIPLGVTNAAAWRGAYSQERWLPVKHLAMYWHFLDVVWILIFATLGLIW